MSQSSISDISVMDQGRFMSAAPAVGTSQSSMSSVTRQSPSPNGTQVTIVPDMLEQVALSVPVLPMIVEARRRSRSPNNRGSPTHTPPRSKSPRHVDSNLGGTGSGRHTPSQATHPPTDQLAIEVGTDRDREAPISNVGSQVPNGRNHVTFAPTVSTTAPAVRYSDDSWRKQYHG